MKIDPVQEWKEAKERWEKFLARPHPRQLEFEKARDEKWRCIRAGIRYDGANVDILHQQARDEYQEHYQPYLKALKLKFEYGVPD
jgi:hypothetical protein